MAGTFTGVMKLKIVEATGLKPPNATGNRLQHIDPYCQIQIDETPVARTTAKLDTVEPKWGEEFETSCHRGRCMELGIFHKELVGDGAYVASVSVPFADFIEGPEGTKSLRVRPKCG